MKDEKIENQKQLFEYLKRYMNDALEKMILRLKKAKIEIDSDLLLLSFNNYYDEYFGNGTD